MLPAIKDYLEEVRWHLHLDVVGEQQIIGELYTHFQEKAAELQRDGMDAEDAAREAVRSCGRARELARLMYEAHSQGSWREAALAALPHFTVAFLFALHLWRHIPVDALVFAVIVAVTLLGWWHGKPNWLYPWVGYALLPLLVTSYLLFPALAQSFAYFVRGQGAPPGAGTLVVACLLPVAAVWITARTTVRVVRRDWILASLMLVPIPVVGSWLATMVLTGGLAPGGAAEMSPWNTALAQVLVVLGVTSALFLRLRQRLLKVGALVTLGVIAFTLTGGILWGHIGFFGFLLTALIALLYLLSPALLEARVGHESAGELSWGAEGLPHPSASR
ncbi:MAG: hypothetical protein ABID87_05175 [Chloroflexota bacterium]